MLLNKLHGTLLSIIFLSYPISHLPLSTGRNSKGNGSPVAPSERLFSWMNTWTGFVIWTFLYFGVLNQMAICLNTSVRLKSAMASQSPFSSKNLTSMSPLKTYNRKREIIINCL